MTALLGLLSGSGHAAGTAPAVVHESSAEGLRVVEIAAGLEHPWGLAFLPDGGILVTERPGRLRLVESGRLRPEALPGTPEVLARGQGGLLDVALHPDFESNRWVYLSYAGSDRRRSQTRVMRARYAPTGLSEQTVIWEAAPALRADKHYGSRLAFGPDGRLYVTVGDRGERQRAQDPADPRGKVLRLEPDGRIPPDNPYVDRADIRPEIYSLGHRNPQGITFEPLTGRLYAHEHGPRGGDEINRIEAGSNYGWPLVSLGREYLGGRIGTEEPLPGTVGPLWHWTPSIAPSGMTFYRGQRFPSWQGDLFVGALKARCLVRLDWDDGRVVREERLLCGVVGRIRDVRTGPDGALYLLEDADDGKLYRVEPMPGAR